MTVKQLKKLNPGVNWYQLRIGQKIAVKAGSEGSIDRTPVATPSKKYYRVKRGDYPIRIAKKYGISLKKLYRLNKGLKNKKYLVVGQKLRVK